MCLNRRRETRTGAEWGKGVRSTMRGKENGPHGDPTYHPHVSEGERTGIAKLSLEGEKEKKNLL